MKFKRSLELKEFVFVFEGLDYIKDLGYVL